MAEESKKNDLGFLGKAFQYKLVKAFLEDKEVYRDLNEIISPNHFTVPVLKTIVDTMGEYFTETNTCPSYDIVELRLRVKLRTEFDVDECVATLREIQDGTSEGRDEIEKQAIRFFRQQNIIKTANEILRITKDGDYTRYEQCVDMLAKAMSAGVHDNYSYRIFDEYENTLSEESRYPIPTGIDKIDESLEGGIGKGEVGMVIGPTGFGKTTLLTAMAQHASLNKQPINNNKGFKVLQIVFEDTRRQIRRKHFSRLSQIEARWLSKPDYIDAVKEKTDPKSEAAQMIQNNIMCIKLPSGEVSANELKNIILRKINEGFTPDLVLLDYFECLKINASKGKDQWEAEGETMRKLESMAEELNIALWVATQGSRGSLSSEIVNLDQAGGSFKKCQIAHIVLSIARSMDDIDNNLATIAFLKNRAGKSGKVYNNVYFDNSTCTINTDNAVEFNNMRDYEAQKDKKRLEVQQELMKQTKRKKDETAQETVKEVDF